MGGSFAAGGGNGVNPIGYRELLGRQARMEIENLPKQAKSVLRLYLFGRKGTKEIAAILNSHDFYRNARPGLVANLVLDKL